MRCPKCKFISYDDLSSCAKCSNDLSALAEDLKGTGTEAKVAFFLSSVIQAQDFDEDPYSTSQTVSLDDSNLSFDETFSDATGDTLGLDLDDSIEISSDDIAIELGDQLPVDLGEIDMHDTGDLNFDATDSLGDADAKSTVDVSTTTAGLDDINFDDDIDLNLTGQLGVGTSDDFDSTEILSQDASDSLSDANIDLDLSGNYENPNVELDLGDVDLDATGMTLSTEGFESDSSALDLDEDLLAELASDTIAPESLSSPESMTSNNLESFDFGTNEESTSLSSDEETFDLDMNEESPSISLNDESFDDDLPAESETISSEDIDALLGDFDDDLGDLDTDEFDDFGDINSSEVIPDTPPTSLDFDDLDVSDLVTSGGDDTSIIDLDDADEEVDLSTLIDETPGTDDDDFDLDMLDEDMPEIELIDED